MPFPFHESQLPVKLIPQHGPWFQLGCLSFLSAGIFADMLLVRLFLSCAYLFNLLNALTDFQNWPFVAPDATRQYTISIDALCWAAVGLYVHGSAFIALLRDERRVPLSEDAEALWRMFYRRSGISRLLFQTQILAHGEFREYERGAVIVGDEVDEPERVHIIMQGSVQARVDVSERSAIKLRLLSGEIFEFRHLHELGIHAGFRDRQMHATATSAVRTFSLSVSSLQTMAKGPAAIRHAWHAVLCAMIARSAERFYPGSHERQAEKAKQQLAGEELEHWRDPAFRELEDDEWPAPSSPGSGACLSAPLTNFAAILAKTFSPPWPFKRPFTGLRHSAMTTLPQAFKQHHVAETSRVVRCLPSHRASITSDYHPEPEARDAPMPRASLFDALPFGRGRGPAGARPVEAGAADLEARLDEGLLPASADAPRPRASLFDALPFSGRGRAPPA